MFVMSVTTMVTECLRLMKVAIFALGDSKVVLVSLTNLGLSLYTSEKHEFVETKWMFDATAAK